MAKRWNPWAELRARSHLRLAFADLPAGTRGLLVETTSGRAVVLAKNLTRRERRATLAHELVHDERDIPTIGGPARLAVKEEAAVDREVARRLVPVDELERLVDRGEPVTVALVCDEFDVPARVAAVALRLLGEQRARARHPTGR